MGVKDLAPPRVKTVKQAVQPKVEDQPLTVRLRQWLENNRKIVSGAAAGVFLIGLILLGIQSYQENRERSARESFALLMQQWPKDMGAADPQTWDSLVSNIQKFVRDHQGSKAAQLAHLDMARAYYQMQRYEDALGQSQKALDEAVEPSLQAMARYQKAVILQTMGRTDDAIAQWNAVKSETSLLSQREVNWTLAQLYRSKKDYSKAVEHLELAVKAEAEYPAGQLLEDELATLRALSAKGS